MFNVELLMSPHKVTTFRGTGAFNGTVLTHASLVRPVGVQCWGGGEGGLPCGRPASPQVWPCKAVQDAGQLLGTGVCPGEHPLHASLWSV